MVEHANNRARLPPLRIIMLTRPTLTAASGSACRHDAFDGAQLKYELT